MRYGIAIWNYCWRPAGLPDAIRHFASQGFDTIGLHPGQFADCPREHLAAVAASLRDLNLAAGVHGACAMDERAADTVIEALGDRLCSVTLDSAMREDSRGRLHDGQRIAAALSRLQRLTEGTDVLLGIEDFPLDHAALEYFRAELGDVLTHPRTGILIDVGHMHMRMKTSSYFSALSVHDYFRRPPVPLVEVHLHDNNGMKDEHGHFGFGSVPFPEIANALRAMKYDGLCTIEIAPSFHGSTPEGSKPKAAESLRTWKTLLGPTPDT